MKTNYILLTAIFPKKKNLIGCQLENCILSIERLKKDLNIFIVTNKKNRVFQILRKNNLKFDNIIVENINVSKKNYISNHKLPDFRYAFGKIQCLKIFLEKKIKFHSIIISDIDAIFTEKIKNLIDKKNIIFTAIDYYSDQTTKQMHQIFSIFIKKYKKVYWINSGFIILNPIDAKIIINKIDQYFYKFKKNGILIKKTINHYGDEILFTLASNALTKKKFVKQSTSVSLKNLFRYQPLAFIWTVNTKKNYIRFLNPFKLSAHIHLPDFKYSKESQKFMKKILSKLKPSFADLILSLWINAKIFKNKIIIYNLSIIKKIFFNK